MALPDKGNRSAESRLKPTRKTFSDWSVDAEMSDEYIPLSQRSAAQLRAEAEQYRRMAATAPADIRDSLLRLAARVEVLADRREGR